MEEFKKMVHIREFPATQQISRRLVIKVKQMECHRGRLMIKMVAEFKKKGKLVPVGERSFRISQR